MLVEDRCTFQSCWMMKVGYSRYSPGPTQQSNNVYTTARAKLKMLFPQFSLEILQLNLDGCTKWTAISPWKSCFVAAGTIKELLPGVFHRLYVGLKALGEINDGERSCLEMRLRHLLKETCLKEEDVVTFGMSMQKILKNPYTNICFAVCSMSFMFEDGTCLEMSKTSNPGR